MWHSVVVLALCCITDVLAWQGIASRWPYLVLWGGGLALWAPIFWALRHRNGPVTAVERQIAHVRARVLREGGNPLRCVLRAGGGALRHGARDVPRARLAARALRAGERPVLLRAGSQILPSAEPPAVTTLHVTASARGCPCPVAGRSLRASCLQLSLCRRRFAILASLAPKARLRGTDSPSLKSRAAQTTETCPIAEPERGAARAPGAGVCRQTKPGWRSAGGIRASAGQDARSERPATGHGQPRAARHHRLKS